MLHKISFAIVFLTLISGCKSNSNKAEKLDTALAGGGVVSGQEIVGLKKGEMVVMTKTEMTEKMRDLQNGVFSLEDKVYGNRKLGSQGLYGDLKSCRRKLASRQYGGNGTLVWTEPMDRVTDKEEDLKAGVDEKSNLVAVSEEMLKDRLQRFQSYSLILKKRQDDFENQISNCKAELAGKELDGDQPSRVLIEEGSKTTLDKSAVNQFMCSYVKEGASFQAFMLNAFAKGWLSLADFNLGQNLLAATLKDSKGKTREHAILFSGWKLAYDSGPVTVGELLNDGKDTKLKAWTHDKKADLGEGQKCLTEDDGEWND